MNEREARPNPHLAGTMADLEQAWEDWDHDAPAASTTSLRRRLFTVFVWSGGEFAARTVDFAKSAKSYKRPRLGSLGRPARYRGGLRAREGESGPSSGGHDMPSVGHLRQRVLRASLRAAQRMARPWAFQSCETRRGVARHGPAHPRGFWRPLRDTSGPFGNLKRGEWTTPTMLRSVLSGKLILLAFLLVQLQGAFAQTRHGLPLVMSASNPVVQGFVRIVNHSDHAGTVEIHSIDDSGQRFGPISLHLEAKASAHFNSDDLESGNADKGLSGGVGSGEGNWRLVLETDLDIEPLAYIRTGDGFVTSMHDLVAEGRSMRHHVPIFNPGGNLAQVSQLRLINTMDTDAAVVIDGLDDRGASAEEEVRLELPAGTARMFSAQELETGGSGFSGRFGDGAGKWHLFISADRPLQVMNLLRSPSGHLTNLSRTTVIRAGVCDERVMTVNFPDLGLQAAVEFALGKTAGAPVSRAELATLTELDAQRRNVKSLTGIECASGLTKLNIANNHISDLSPLSGLRALTWLGLWNNPTADLSPLSELFALRWLNLWGTGVSDLSPLSGLTALAFLELGNNQISDIAPLSGLRALTSLDLDQNLVTDVLPLSGLTALTELELQNNRISKLSPLSGLTALTELNLGYNLISDVSPISGLTELSDLSLRENQITNVSPLSELRNLTTLHLATNQISDLSPLAGLRSLTWLALWVNPISDLSPLSGLRSLTWLNLWGAGVSGLSPLSRLTALTFLELGNNQISDIAPLSGLRALTSLDLDQNLVTDVSALSGLIALTELELANNRISDIAPLVSNPGLDNGDILTLSNNPLSLESRSRHIATLRARGVDVSF